MGGINQMQTVSPFGMLLDLTLHHRDGRHLLHEDGLAYRSQQVERPQVIGLDILHIAVFGREPWQSSGEHEQQDGDMPQLESFLDKGQIVWHVTVSEIDIHNLRQQLRVAEKRVVSVDEIVNILIRLHDSLQVHAGHLLTEMTEVMEDGLFHKQGTATLSRQRVTAGHGEPHQLPQLI